MESEKCRCFNGQIQTCLVERWLAMAMDLGRPKAMKPQFKELFQHNLNTEWHGGDRGAASPKFSDCVDTVIPEKGDDARDPQSRR